ncbi:MAG: cysteine protease StiP family protein [Oscillospiraceae bacterium]|nr:cysteine protease StiP family protein [Oscillospiraceae bacterium]
MKLVKTSYDSNDVTILLKDLTGIMIPLPTEEREKQIQSGAHYSSMLPLEKLPSKEYLDLYFGAVEHHKYEIAQMTANLAAMIAKSPSPVIISLARAGIPVGVLLKRYLSCFFGCECPHYAISIIRDKGIDVKAMEYIYEREKATGHSTTADIFFVDGWTGKGAIKNQLSEAVESLIRADKKWLGLRDDLYVLADPANITPFCGTHEDFLLPTACLNSIVSGLISRSILNEHISVSDGDFHGAVYFADFEQQDLSRSFVDEVSECFAPVSDEQSGFEELSESGLSVVKRICEHFDIKDYLKVKPGIGETTRVLLRRVPWAVLIDERANRNDFDLRHIFALCEEKGVRVIPYNLGSYKACGIIKELADA